MLLEEASGYTSLAEIKETWETEEATLSWLLMCSLIEENSDTSKEKEVVSAYPEEGARSLQNTQSSNKRATWAIRALKDICALRAQWYTLHAGRRGA